jgi:acyloxyacyl hydrolase
MDTIWPVVQGSTRSLYLNMYNLNKCNFRDYQNVAVNGADTESILNIMKSLKRDPVKDQPMLVVYSLVGKGINPRKNLKSSYSYFFFKFQYKGNDVCNGNPDTVNHMTKPKDFYNNVIQAMNYLDTMLPPGSHVLLTGLANGSLLYQSIGENIYPIGRVKNDVKYSDVYTYLSCLQVFTVFSF